MKGLFFASISVFFTFGKQEEQGNTQPQDFADHQGEPYAVQTEEIGQSQDTYRRQHQSPHKGNGGGYGTVVAAPNALEMWDRLGENYRRVLK